MAGYGWPLLAVGFALLSAVLGGLWWRARATAPVPPLPPRAPVPRTRERKLRARLRAYRRAADALPDATVVLDGDGQRIRWFNEASTRLLGLQRPRDIGEPFARVMASARIAAWLEQGAADALMDVPAPADETLRLSLRLIDDGGGTRMLVARDMSKLAHLEQVRRDFVANVSHELRTPLTVVHGYLDLMDEDDMPAYAGMLAEMRSQSRRMGQIVEDLLTLSRLEARDELEMERVSLRGLLVSLQRDANALSAGRHQVELSDAAPLDLLGSSKELQSAFSNLVSNAVRYTPAGGRIRIAFEREGDGARLAVTDTGHGIPAQHLPRITERFYRVSTSRSRESGGTGLGLSIVKHVLNLHQARLSIESEVGRGSTFACHFDAGHVLPRAADGE